MIKTPAEIQGIRAACQAAKEVLKEALVYADVGINIADIDRRIMLHCDDLLVYSGCFGYKNFPSFACFSINEQIVHGTAKDRRLKEGDVLKIDVIIKKGDFYGDTCKTKIIGNKYCAYKEELLEVTKKCLELGIGVAQPGNKLCDIGNTINSYVSTLKDYDIVRQFCGHGIGRSIHEPPQILNHYNDNKTKIMPGMVFTVEPILVNRKNPKYYLDSNGHTVFCKKGIIGCQFEDTILILPNGNEVLTL